MCKNLLVLWYTKLPFFAIPFYWAIDQKFDLTYLDDKNFSTKTELDNQVQMIIRSILYTYHSWTWSVSAGIPTTSSYYTRKSMIDTPTEAIDKYLTDEFENRFKQILEEELSFRTVEKKQDIKNQISYFITTFSKNEEYVELPYYLVISAKRAGLWDLEKLQFSYKYWKIFAVGQIHDLRSIWDIEVEKEFVEQVRDTFTSEEMQYINLVNFAHHQVEELRSIEWGGSREDDLDIPIEIEHSISQWYKDWNTFVGRLKSYDPQMAQSLLQEEYKKYYEYFNSLYLWILFSLNSFTWSNDIDTMGMRNLVLYYGDGSKFFDEKWDLKKNKDWKLEIKGKEVEEFYNEQLEVITYNWKTIKSLWISEDKKEKEIAQWYSIQIIVAILESRVLRLDDKGNTIGLWNGRDGNNTTKWVFNKSKTDEKLFSLRLSDRLAKNPFCFHELTFPSEYKQQQELHIQSYSQRAKTSEKVSKVLQKNIENMLPTVEWQWKRGDIKYNPENSTLESRWRKIKVEFVGDDKIRVLGFPRDLDIGSWLWLLNFINRYKFTYSNLKQELTHDVGLFTRNGIFGKKMIVGDNTLKKNIINLSDSEIDKIVKILNN